LAIAGTMPSKGGRHRPGVEAIYEDAIARLLDVYNAPRYVRF
jgi:hypothetical protein